MKGNEARETRTVLIIEDEDDIRDVAQMALEMTAGWDVIAAASGSDGIQIARQRKPDAILLDVMMPGLDGPATLQQLAADPATRAIPVIFMTAKVQAADRGRLAQTAARAVLTKPFDPMTLAREISAVLDW